ncbi:hypothetical protein D3C86_2142690 [compost metagenome]
MPGNTPQAHRMLAGHQVMIPPPVGRGFDRIPGNKHAVHRRCMQEGITDNASGAVTLTRNLCNQRMRPHAGGQYHRVGCNAFAAR